VSNQGKNRLYLNKTEKETGITFEDASEKAQIGGSANWKTGVDCASGRYVYVLDYQLNDETERQTKRGFINLFR
jgi:hypothetical protein